MSFDLRDLNTQSAPLQVKYSQITPLGLSASSKRVSFFPSNAGTFGAGSVIRIPISSGSCFQDGTLSCLKFQYTNADAANGAQIDGSAHSFIQSIRVISRSGGVDLENIRYYNKLVNMLSDLQLNEVDRASRYHEGYGSGNYTTQTGAVFAGCGEPTIAANGTMDFYLPLLSAVLGSGQSRYLPLFLCGQIDLEIQIATNPTIGAAAPNFSINNVEFQTQLIEFAGDMNNTLLQLCKSTGLYIHATSWYSDKIQVSGTVVSALVAERLASVKSLFCYTSIPRTATTMRENSRTASAVTSFQLKCGSTFFPNQPITGNATKEHNGSFITETYKAIGDYANIHGKALMNANNWATNGNVTADCGRAVYGIDLDAFVSKGSNIESGFDFVNNNPCNINMVGTFGAAADMYIHIMHDILIKIDQNFTLTASR